MTNFKAATRRAAASSLPSPNVLPKEDIKFLLNGFARVIEFGTFSLDKDDQLDPTIDNS